MTQKELHNDRLRKEAEYKMLHQTTRRHFHKRKCHGSLVPWHWVVCYMAAIPMPAGI